MPDAIATVALDVQSYALTTTANSVAGTSGTLTNGNTYLVIGQGNASTTSGSGTDVDAEFHIGGTVFARMQSEHGPFSPSGSLGSVSNGGLHSLGVAVTYTAGAGDDMEYQAWGGGASGEANGHWYALDLTNLVDETDRWHEESANSDTIVTTPAAASGYVDVGTALTFTPPDAGDYLIIASAEFVADGTAASSDEFDPQLTVGGTAVSGTNFLLDVGGRADTIQGYLVATVQTFTATSQTIAIQLNGTSSNGNIGARRIRIHAIRVASIDGSDVQELNDAAETVSGTADADIMSGTFGNGTDNYLIISRVTKQVSFWTEGYHLVGGTEQPTEGFGQGAGNFGLGAANDMAIDVGVSIASAPAASSALAYRISKVGGGGDTDTGSDTARGGGESSLIAIRLATPDAAINLTPSADVAQWTTPAPTITLGAVTVSPAADAGQWTTPAPSILLGGLTLTPSAEVARFVTPAPALVLSGVTVSPAADGSQWVTPAPALSLGAVTLAPTPDVARWVTPAAVIGLGAVTLTPAADVAQWNTPPAVASLSGGPITLTPAADVARWSTPAATISAPAVLTPGASVVQITTPAPTVSVGAVVRQPAASVARWATPAPTVVLGAVTLSPAPQVSRWATPTPSVGSVLRPAADGARFVTPAPAVVLGGVTLAPAAVVGRWVTPTATVAGGADLFVAPYGLTVAPDLAMGMTIAPDLSMGMTIDED